MAYRYRTVPGTACTGSTVCNNESKKCAPAMAEFSTTTRVVSASCRLASSRRPVKDKTQPLFEREIQFVGVDAFLLATLGKARRGVAQERQTNLTPVQPICRLASSSSFSLLSLDTTAGL
jgi:hypothetical protein